MYTYGNRVVLGKDYNNIVPYFYKERNVLLSRISKRYYQQKITGKQYSEECQEVSRKTLEKIEEAEQQIMVNKIAGRKQTEMKSLLDEIVYIRDS